ncbi:hypothetical protein PLICRDRAFT_53420 [Plicaturopsis crispa FD-325 SS-3]|nr:hypothetical protein PLICRDRAFT_53420 [Plicaturopsis crispa FD-325 SS-3]
MLRVCTRVATRPRVSSKAASSVYTAARRRAAHTESSARPASGYKTLGAFVLGSAVALGAGILALRNGYALPGGPPSSTESKYGSLDDAQAAIAELRKALPSKEAIDVDIETLRLYGFSENSYHPSSPHSVVVRPRTTEDVVKVVNISRKYRIPIVAFSGGTALEGHFSGTPTGSICLDMAGMDQIININEDDADLTCQAGAQWENINQALADKGIPLFFPIDPGPGATIGGMIATGCSGTNAVRYGTAKGEWFLNATVVLPSGEVIKTRSRARKSAAGWDATKLFIGAEGTLGIVTEATLRLAPVIPTQVALAQFSNVQNAVSAVQEILQTPYGPHIQCIEFCDDNMMDAVNEGGLVAKPLPVTETLFFKIQGAPEAIKQTADTVRKIVKRHKSSKFEFAANDEEGADLWQSRKYALKSTLEWATGYRLWVTDVCVPVSRLPQLVAETKEDIKKAGIEKYTIVGHVGDGNFHALLLFKDDKELAIVSDAVHRLVHRAIAMDGTCTGEHGVGVGKKEYLVDELGAGTVELMRAVKKAIDPLDLMNPGKLYPDETKHPVLKDTRVSN